jgi:cyclophilin family peptidyl-prolyl cis-trans isomerase
MAQANPGGFSTMRIVQQTARQVARVAGTARRWAAGLGSRGTHAWGASRAERLPLVEGLEPRQLMTVNILNPIADQTAVRNAAPIVIGLANRYDNPNITGTVVRWNTGLGGFNVELFDAAGPGRTRTTPLTAANFLNYVDAGRYASTIIHRSLPGFVLQGGGFITPSFDNVAPSNLTTFAPVQNEPGTPGQTNVAGTIALAKLGGNPNSGTSQFFINLADNTGNLDFQNGGFTAFGRILGNGLGLAQQLATVPRTSDWEFFLGRGNDNFAYTVQPDPSSGQPGLPLQNQPNIDNLTTVRPADYVSFNITRTSEITYTATSSNPTLVTPGVSNNQLTLTLGNNQVGTATITVRATAADGTFTDDSFLISVGAAPSLSSLQLGSTSVTRPGNFTVSATGVSDADGTVARVEYYRDSNDNGVLDVGTDTLIGQGTNAANNYSATISSAAFPGGNNRLFARAVDDSGLFSPSRTAVLNVVAQRPVIGSFTASPSVVTRAQNLTLSAGNVLAGAGSVSRVDFHVDSNRNGVLDASDTRLAQVSTPTGNAYVHSAAAVNLPGGAVRFFATAFDSTGTASLTSSALATVQTQAPTLTSLTLDPTTAAPGGTINLIANGAASTGTLAKVQFFRDSNGNGVFDATTDTLLGEDNNADGGYRFTFNATGLTGGASVRFFARAVDGDGLFSPVRTAVATIGRPPAITGVTISPTAPVTRPASLTLTASGVSDPDNAIARVEFYRDSNNNGVIDIGTDALLGSDTSAAGGWTLTFPTTGLPLGSLRFLARAVDATNLVSSTVSVNGTVQNARPLPGTLTISPSPYNRTTPITLTLSNPTDTDGTVVRAEFFLDTNRSGLLDSGDEALSVDEDGTNGWSSTGASAGIPNGLVRIFATVVDNDGLRSLPTSAVVQVATVAPTAGTLTVSPASITPTQNFTLTLTGFSEALTPTKAQFYRDSNNNGVFDAATDALIGEDNDRSNGFSIQASPVITSGTVRFFARVQDSEGVFSAAVTATGSVGQVPTVSSMTVTPSSAQRPANVTLTMNGASAVGGTLDRAEFYRDNGDNNFDPATDTLIASNTLPATNGLTTTLSNVSLAAGQVRFFARVRNTLGQFSSAVTGVHVVTNRPPTLTGISSSPTTFVRGSTITLTGLGAADPDGTVARVQFFRDTNGNGTLDGSDTNLGEQTTGTAGTFARSGISTSGFSLGANRVFARAVDNEGGQGAAVSMLVNVTGTAPTISSLLSSPSTGPRSGSFTLRALGVSVPGSTVQQVQFFRDTGNGVFDATVDTLLGTGTLDAGSGEYRRTIAGTSLVVGANRLFARVQNADGVWSNAVQLIVNATA